MIYGCLAELEEEIGERTTEAKVHPALSYYVPGPSRGTATPVPRKEVTVCEDADITNLETRISMIVVKRIVDGDTVEAELDTTSYRLWGIDAPEMSQPMGHEAKAALENELPPGRVVQAHLIGKDPYGRHLAIIGVRGTVTANYNLVAQGLAWAYPAIGHNGCLQSAQRDARNLGRGIWGEPGLDPVPPWEYRHGRQSGD